MKKYYFIYCTTNIISGKKYIGYHSSTNLNDGYFGSGTALKDAIKRYGKENFKREILEFLSENENHLDIEEKYIRDYKTITPEGYNISPRGGLGLITPEIRDKIGNGHRGKTQSEEAKRKIGKYRKGKKPWNKGISGVIKHSDESNKKKGREGKQNSFYGKKHSPETIEKMRNAKLGEKNPMHSKNKNNSLVIN